MKCSTPVIHKTLLEQHLGQGCFPESLTTGKNSPRKHMNKTNKRSKHITRDVSPTFIHQSISICHHKQLFGSPLENAPVLHLKPLVPQPRHSPHTRAAHAHQMAAGVHKPGEGLSPSMSEKGHSHHTVHPGKLPVPPACPERCIYQVIHLGHCPPVLRDLERWLSQKGTILQETVVPQVGTVLVAQ